jgi:hypothetical protein
VALPGDDVRQWDTGEKAESLSVLHKAFPAETPPRCHARNAVGVSMSTSRHEDATARDTSPTSTSPTTARCRHGEQPQGSRGRDHGRLRGLAEDDEPQHPLTAGEVKGLMDVLAPDVVVVDQAEA